MAEAEVVITAPKATVYIERKIQVRQYESLTVGIHYPVDLPITTSFISTEDEQKAANDAIKAAFFTAKMHVYEQAGLKFEDRDGVILEMITAKFDGSAEVVSTSASPTLAPRARGAAEVVQTDDFPPAPATLASGSRQPPAGFRKAPPAADDLPRCPKCGSEVWDNRPRKVSGQYSARAADFRCKNKSCGHSIFPQ